MRTFKQVNAAITAAGIDGWLVYTSSGLRFEGPAFRGGIPAYARTLNTMSTEQWVHRATLNADVCRTFDASWDFPGGIAGVTAPLNR